MAGGEVFVALSVSDEILALTLPESGSAGGFGWAGMFCLAFVSAVEPTAAGEPGHGPFDDPSVAAESL
ncbi:MULTISPECIES: hypothetical protein [unclassified Streptomyces]|uniref:hypothetical protein n=1 Tax=unclassified Streptomyces TaxID=2593676 RepID=UPI0013A6DE94|nr:MULTISPECIES: hypothetical protein [unclassified Streptomyces]